MLEFDKHWYRYIGLMTKKSEKKKGSSAEKKNVHSQQNVSDKNQVSAVEVTQKLEVLQIQNGEEQVTAHNQNVADKVCKRLSTYTIHQVKCGGELFIKSMTKLTYYYTRIYLWTFSTFSILVWLVQKSVN